VILLAADFVIAACGLVGSAALSLLVTVIMARAVGVEEFGLYSWAFAYVNLWAPVMDGGASLLAVREVARGRGEVVAGLLALKPLQLAVPLGLMLGAAGAAGVEPGVLWLITLLAVSSAVDTCFGLASAAFRGRGRFGRDALHQLGQRSLFALLAAGALSWGAGVVGVAGARAASLAVAAVTALGFLGRDGAARWLRLEGWGRIRPLVPMLVIDLMTQALARSAHLILRMTRGLGEVGVYAAASRLVEGLGLLPAAVGIALLPRLAAAHRRGPEVVAAELGAGLRSASLLAVVAAGAGLLWAEELVTRVFGGAYAASAVPLRILMGVLV
jgi:PST family polysaccharide transporter